MSSSQDKSIESESESEDLSNSRDESSESSGKEKIEAINLKYPYSSFAEHQHDIDSEEIQEYLGGNSFEEEDLENEAKLQKELENIKTKEFLEKINDEDQLGETILSRVLKSKKVNERKDLIEYLLQNKADLNNQDMEEGSAAITSAFVNSHISDEMISFLVEKGAKINKDSSEEVLYDLVTERTLNKKKLLTILELKGKKIFIERISVGQDVQISTVLN